MDIVTKTKKLAQRMTPLRLEIANIFKKSSKPLSAQEIMALVKTKGFSPNRTTIYREIDFFEQNNLIREVQLHDSKKRYEVAQEGCIHHLVCRVCKEVKHIPLGDAVHLLEEDIQKSTGFRVEKHTVEFYGVCSDCIRSTQKV